MEICSFAKLLCLSQVLKQFADAKSWGKYQILSFENSHCFGHLNTYACTHLQHFCCIWFLFPTRPSELFTYFIYPFSVLQPYVEKKKINIFWMHGFWMHGLQNSIGGSTAFFPSLRTKFYKYLLTKNYWPKKIFYFFSRTFHLYWPFRCIVKKIFR